MRGAPRHGRFQYSVRTALLAVSAVAAVLALGRMAGYFVACGTAVAVVILIGALRSHRRGPFLLLRALAGVLALAAMWFLTVDGSWFVEDCDYCHMGWDVMQYRVCGVVIHERRLPSETIMAKIAEDLGVPCPHKVRRWHKYRFWGLVYPACPAISGIYRIGDDREWYDERAAELVRLMGRENPDLAREYRQKVLLDFDGAYWQRFLCELEAMREDVENAEGDSADEADSSS